MTYKPTHSEFDPFPVFTAEEMQFYGRCNRLLRAALLEQLRSVGQLFAKWRTGSN